MTDIDYSNSPAPIREDVTAVHRRAWRRLAGPGTWLTGRQRVAIAAEVRHAVGCRLCTKRKAALSPNNVDGTHDSLRTLPAVFVDVIHRVRTDPGRLTKRWFQGLSDDGMSDVEYVETVGVIATVVAVDTFALAMGMALLPLPQPLDGEPSRQRPAGAQPERAWVPIIAPEDAMGPEADLYGGASVAAYIRRALSLVPDEVRGFFDIVETQYLPAAAMRDFTREFRAISHAQIELIAGRVSSLNGCVY